MLEDRRDASGILLGARSLNLTSRGASPTAVNQTGERLAESEPAKDRCVAQSFPDLPYKLGRRSALAVTLVLYKITIRGEDIPV